MSPFENLNSSMLPQAIQQWLSICRARQQRQQDNLQCTLRKRIKEDSCLAVVYDLNGREAAEAGIILDALPHLEQYIFCSSAGVYKKSDEMPHREVDEGDPKSRHKVTFCQRHTIVLCRVQPDF